MTQHEFPTISMETELPDTPVSLCDARGRLNPDAVGWSRSPLHDCAIPGRWPRKKRWNYWCFTSPTHLFSITASTLDYAGLFFAYFLDFETKEFIEATITVPFARGCTLPDTVDGAIHYAGNGIDLTMNTQEGSTSIRVKWNRFGKQEMSAAFEVRPHPDHETLNVVIPWDKKRFQFTSKQECLPASGEVRIGPRTVNFDKASTFACLDFGRGVWPYRCFWNWGAASGLQEGRAIGLNFGAGWTDGTGLTENGVVVDGRLHKISEDVIFDYDPANYMNPWRIATKNTERVQLKFTPFYERFARSNLGIIRSEVHQMIGHYSGHITLGDGQQVRVSELLGWAEDHHARW